jgi:replicative superfamily II helicase
LTTFERANAFLCAATEGNYLDRIELIAIDEVHMLSDLTRGCIRKALIMKPILCRRLIRIILLSATLCAADIGRLAQWIGGVIYMSSSRPAPLTQHVVRKEGTYWSISCRNPDATLEPLRRFDDMDFALKYVTWAAYTDANAKVLSFVNTWNKAIEVARRVGKHIAKRCAARQIAIDHALSAAQKTLSTKLQSEIGPDETRRLIGCGVFYDSAALESQCRRSFEKATVVGTVRVLVATTTLAVGVDIPGVTTIIVLDNFMWERSMRTPLSVVDYTQMIGRAGGIEGSPGNS